MTRIVKSTVVVDGREQAGSCKPPPEVGFARRSVIKQGSAGIVREQPRTQQGYLDTLNSLKVEIEESKQELRKLHRELSEAEEAIAQRENEAQAAAGREGLTREKVRAMLEGARVQTDRILEQAQAEASQVREEARNEGLQQGLSQGYEQAREEYQQENNPKVQALGELLDRLANLEQESLRKNEGDMVRLVMAVAEKILGKALKESPKLVASMLYEVLDSNRREEYIKVSLSSDLLPLEAKVGTQVRKLLEDMLPGVIVVADKDMQPGGMAVETPKGITDIGIGTQLSNIEIALLEGSLEPGM